MHGEVSSLPMEKVVVLWELVVLGMASALAHMQQLRRFAPPHHFIKTWHCAKGGSGAGGGGVCPSSPLFS